MNRILIATGDTKSAETIAQSFSKSTNQISIISDSDDCKVAISELSHDVFFVDLDLMIKPDERVQDVKHKLFQFHPAGRDSHLIVIVRPERIRQAVSVVKAVASDYLTLPVNSSEVKLVMENLIESNIMELELEYLRDRFWKSDTLGIARSKSTLMQQVINQVRSVAGTNSTVLLTGESGTGKGVIARLIHRHSKRKDHQFIGIHCGAIPESLLESELFGHERGAFTGADKRKLGKLDIAQQGTIFLDEIGTISPGAQIKLLQVLQERIYNRIGGEHSIDADVRVIAATNSNLETMVESGSFRQDLYYRLKVFPIELPPLRKRPEDIPMLCETFLENLNTLHGKEITGIDEGVLEAFMQYSWPGNIRELENVMERSYILESSRKLSRINLPVEIVEHSAVTNGNNLQDGLLPLSEYRKRGMDKLERKYLTLVLGKNNGRIDKSASDAGVTVRQMHKLMTKHKINKADFKKPGKGNE